MKHRFFPGLIAVICLTAVSCASELGTPFSDAKWIGTSEKVLYADFLPQYIISADIDISSSRICIVPIGTKAEKLCYEFSGDYNGSTYYVYIDAISGRQVEMFKVIESTEGQLLM